MTADGADRIRRVLEPLVREIGIREVARRADVTAGAVSQWLAGTSDLRVGTLHRIAAACGCRIVAEQVTRRRRRAARG
ncbi:MAG: helix-turn-helix transcriptional regulator [Pirellulales bacterium]|nr:helix-turn-helix transcriptional regulator [Pirellulales bacterium]